MEQEILERVTGVSMSREFYQSIVRETEQKQSHLISLGDMHVAGSLYFDKLLVETVRSRCMSLFTLAASVKIMENRMEKEHPENRSALNSNSILHQSQHKSKKKFENGGFFT